MIKKNQALLITIWVVLLGTCSNVLADVPTNNALDQIQNFFSGSANNWSFILSVYAARLFWILVLIDLAWLGIQLALNPGEFSDFFAALVRKILFIGFFWILLQPVGGGPAGGQARGIQWANDIVISLVQAAGQANNWAGGTPNITPSNVFDTGYNLCSQIFNSLKFWSPGGSLALVIGGIIIMVCFALIAAMMLLMYVQSYIVVYAGVILLGFGGSMFTKDISLMYFRAALAVGVKLFVMILIVGIGQIIITQWTATFTVNFEQIILFTGAAIVLLALVKTIPDMVADLINGFSWGSGQALTHSAARVGKTVAGATIGAAAGAAGGSMAVAEAVKLAGTQGAKGAMGTTAATVKNLAAGGVDYSKGRLTGEIYKHGGTTGGKIAAQIAKKHGLTPQKESTNNKDEPYISAAFGKVYPDRD